MARRRCSVAGSVSCEAPPGSTGTLARGTVTRCYVCGNDVCRSPYCSCLHRTEYPVGAGQVRTRQRVRTCANCLEQRYGTWPALAVMARAVDDREVLDEVTRRLAMEASVDDPWRAVVADVRETINDRVRTEARARRERAQLSEHTRNTLRRIEDR